ncbi:nucleoside hydrolase [Nocardioides sp.]|uniref:nucleoside hydrolase n=1 Tax=Nocardioides sp. TaxID=35761 RepID=UPI0039E5F13F
MTSPFILDCDAGIDDAMAILLLLSEPGVDVVAITNTFGNVDVHQATANTLALLELAGRCEVPVSTGAEHPLRGDFDGGALFVHGSNGLGGVTLPPGSAAPTGEHAAQTIARLARHHAGELNLICTGPLTNVALALDAEPDLPRLIPHLTVMGGAAMVPGNVSPVAEANIGNDPEAAAAVFEAPWSITMVGLDVTMEHLFTDADRRRLLDAPGRTPRAIGAMLDTYFAFYEPILGFRGSALHDPMATAIATGALAPLLAPTVHVSVDTTDGPGRGQTIADLRGCYRGYPEQAGAHCRVVLDVEPFAPLLLDRLLSL